MNNSWHVSATLVADFTTGGHLLSTFDSTSSGDTQLNNFRPIERRMVSQFYFETPKENFHAACYERSPNLAFWSA